MNDEQALARMQELVRAAFYRLSRSARLGMRAHGIRTSDVLQILLDATECVAQENATWRVEDISLDRETRVLFAFSFRGHMVQIVSAHLIVERGL